MKPSQLISVLALLAFTAALPSPNNLSPDNNDFDCHACDAYFEKCLRDNMQRRPKLPCGNIMCRIFSGQCLDCGYRRGCSRMISSEGNDDTEYPDFESTSTAMDGKEDGFGVGAESVTV